METVDPFAPHDPAPGVGHPQEHPPAPPQPPPAGSPSKRRPASTGPKSSVTQFLRDAWGEAAFARSAYKRLLDSEAHHDQMMERYRAEFLKQQKKG